jgi:hypothetical protein
MGVSAGEKEVSSPQAVTMRTKARKIIPRATSNSITEARRCQYPQFTPHSMAGCGWRLDLYGPEYGVRGSFENLFAREADRVCEVIRHVAKDSCPLSGENWTLVLGSMTEYRTDIA